MVEASMVLPLLILSLLTCLLVSMFFYETTLRQCQLHQAMRGAADDLTGHTVRLTADLQGPEETTGTDGEFGEITTARQGLFHIVKGKEKTIMIHQGILHSRVSENLESIWHATDGVDYVRYCRIIKSPKDGR